jgi:hypothetical protein
MVPPAGGVIDCLVEERPHGTAAPVRWSEYVPDGLLADMLAHPADAGPEHREFESLERIGAWERVIAWAQAGQLRESTPSCAVRTLATLSGCQHVAGAGLGGGRGRSYAAALGADRGRPGGRRLGAV